MADLLVNNPNWQSFASNLELDRGLHPGLLAGIMKNETAGGHPDIINATSSAGAQGAFQFMPGTAQQYNVNVKDSADSTRGAADYLGDLTKKYRDPLLAGAAYNWGPGNVDKAIKAAAGAGVPTDALSLANHGFLPKETAGYVVKLAAHLDGAAAPAPAADAPSGVTPYPKDLVDAVQSHVVNMAQQGASPVNIVTTLQQSPVGDMIASMKKSGLSPEDIVKQVGGTPLATAQAARDKIGQQGFFTNLKQGADNAYDDVALGAKQLFTSDPDQTQALQQQALANQQDPTRRALSDTVGGTIGGGAIKAIPTAAAIAAAPETLGGSLALLGGAGALQGALTPTTEDGQRWKNMGTEAALNAGGGALGAGVGKLGSMAAKALMPSAGATADAAALAAQRAKLGWASSVADLNSTAGAIRDALPGVKLASEDVMRKDMAKTVLERIGQTGDELSPENVAIARENIYKPVDAALKGVTIPSDISTIAPKLGSIVQKYEADTLPTYRSPEVQSAALDVVNKINAGNMTADALLQAKKNILGNAWKADGDTKMALKAIGNAIDEHLNQVAPQVTKPLQVANDQWRHLQVVENALNRVNGQGDLLTPRSFAQSVKAVNRDQFQAGEAPFQDVADALLQSQGTNSSSSLAGLLAKGVSHGTGVIPGAIYGGAHGALTALAAKVLAGTAGKVVNSTNPAVVKLLTGVGRGPVDPTLAAYISKALQGTGAEAAN